MAMRVPAGRSHLTLGLCVILHAFTHAYGSMLVPLYLQIFNDLKLSGVGAASLVVSLYGATYNLGSYFAGLLADRYDRKLLLSIGLFGNALAILGIGLARNYPAMLVLGILAGVFGTLFHPSALALCTSHYPKRTGTAIGLLGMGAGLGFFFGPQLAGWRAESAAWHLDSIAQWQKPCVEMAVAGFIVGIIFLFLGLDPHGESKSRRPPMEPALRKRIIKIASVLMFRDFAGVAGMSLASIYIQRVFGMNVKSAGFFVGLMMLFSVAVNPLSASLTSGRRRFPALVIILICGGLMAISVPIWGTTMAIVALCGFQTLQLASYVVSDSSMLERVARDVRGRVVGLFLVIAGSFGALGPWVMGYWSDRLGKSGTTQSAYYGPFAVVGICMIVAAIAPRFINQLGAVHAGEPIKVAEEISPATMGGVA